ncbi:MAG: redoxin family protein [Crocinitomicaceae bacterium]|nr:redoxin family protein [Crocinitomicaceae bacterium]
MMSSVELSFLDMGFSWTMSKALPYVLAMIIGLVLAFLFRKKLNKNVLVKWLFRITLFVLPFFGYFMYSPIYEGDFTNKSNSIEKTEQFAELDGKKLVVISIPGCPYCYQAIDRMKILKERLPNAQIEYVVCNTTMDSLLPQEALDWYIEKAEGVVSVRQATDSEAMAILAQNGEVNSAFPAFVLVDGDKNLTTWGNANFGVVALDEVELKLK